jgi:hypothetical protein
MTATITPGYSLESNPLSRHYGKRIFTSSDGAQWLAPLPTGRPVAIKSGILTRVLYSPILAREFALTAPGLSLEVRAALIDYANEEL